MKKYLIMVAVIVVVYFALRQAENRDVPGVRAAAGSK